MTRANILSSGVAAVAALALALPAVAVAAPAPLAELLTEHGIRALTPPVAAPDFTLPRLDGVDGSLSERQGDWVVLTFFATWCGPCRSEMPTLERLHQSHGEDGLAVLAVSVDQRRDPVEPFVSELGLSFPVFWDRNGEVGDAYHAGSIPVSYLIDPVGRIVGLARGARDWSATAPLFASLLETTPAAGSAAAYLPELAPVDLSGTLQPPTAEWALSPVDPQPGRPFHLEVLLGWSGRLEDYLPQPPRIALPEGVTRGAVAAASSSLDGRSVVRYTIELIAAEPGRYALDPIELRYTPAFEATPIAARVAGPTVGVAAPEAAGLSPALWATTAVGVVIAAPAVLLLVRRRRAGRAGAAADEGPHQRLRRDLDEAKRLRLAGDAAAAFEILAAVAGQVETDSESGELEGRLEAVRFGGRRPDASELEGIERRLERGLEGLRPDPDAARRRGLRLRDDRPRPTTEETA